jgi:hypothetical protein
VKQVFYALPLVVQRRIRNLLDPGSGFERFRMIESLKTQHPTPEKLSRLRESWGGAGVADIDYLVQVVRHARETGGPILECGSGLTTMLLGLYAHHPVFSLEENPYWTRRVTSALRWHRLAEIRVINAPIRAYKGFDWYTVPPDLPKQFTLVICDGPVSHQKTGCPRYGLLPVMGPRVRGATILMDDAERPSEQMALERWVREFGAHVSMPEVSTRRYAVVKI